MSAMAPTTPRRLALALALALAAFALCAECASKPQGGIFSQGVKLDFSLPVKKGVHLYFGWVIFIIL